MNTHSKTADGRRETLCTHAALCGGDRELVERLYHTITCDEAIPLLDEAGLRERVMESIAAALGENLRRRAGGMAVEALFFSNRYGVLGQTAGAEKLLALHQDREEQP